MNVSRVLSRKVCINSPSDGIFPSFVTPMLFNFRTFHCIIWNAGVHTPDNPRGPVWVNFFHGHSGVTGMQCNLNGVEEYYRLPIEEWLSREHS